MSQDANFAVDGYTLATLHGYAEWVCWTVAEMMEAKPLDHKGHRDMLWYAMGEIANGLGQLGEQFDGHVTP